MAASACSSWPTAKAASGGYEVDSRRNPPVVTLTLAGAAEEWRTPQCGDAKRGPKSRRAACQGYQDQAGRHSLATETAHWSTPRASDGEKGGPNMRGSKGDLPLPNQAAHWPTPRVGGQGGYGSAKRALDPANCRLEDTVSDRPTPMTRDHRSGYSQKSAEELWGTKGRPLERVATDFRPPHQVPPILAGLPSSPPILDFYRRTRATTDSALRSEMRALLRMGIRSRGPGWTRKRPAPFVRPSFRRRLNPTFVEWLMRMPFGLSGFEREATELTRWLARMRTCLSTLHSPSIAPPQGRLL
jgi:hypothetical protein